MYAALLMDPPIALVPIKGQVVLFCIILLTGYPKTNNVIACLSPTLSVAPLIPTEDESL